MQKGLRKLLKTQRGSPGQTSELGVTTTQTGLKSISALLLLENLRCDSRSRSTMQKNPKKLIPKLAAPVECCSAPLFLRPMRSQCSSVLRDDSTPCFRSSQRPYQQPTIERFWHGRLGHPS